MNLITRQSSALAALLAAGMLAVASFHAVAASSDPALARVEAFDDALIAAMKAGAAAGAKGRDRELTPAVEAAFDLPTMTRLAVGESWTGMTEAQHAELVRAFSRYTTANYAHNFDAYSGQKFVAQAVQDRGTNKVVQVQLVAPHGSSTALIYVLRQTAGSWKIVDVYYNGISQITTRRSDFASSLQSGGAAALLSRLQSLTAKLLS